MNIIYQSKFISMVSLLDPYTKMLQW